MLHSPYHATGCLACPTLAIPGMPATPAHKKNLACLAHHPYLTLNNEYHCAWPRTLVHSRKAATAHGAVNAHAGGGVAGHIPEPPGRAGAKIYKVTGIHPSLAYFW
mmetsp:Transcript_97601/g.164205  ORF Transcript_97601/g.164205 Transcript_97601/m.164205 type:complete len:106 (-) Transcript_97601:183-500(-)